MTDPWGTWRIDSPAQWHIRSQRGRLKRIWTRAERTENEESRRTGGSARGSAILILPPGV